MKIKFLLLNIGLSIGCFQSLYSQDTPVDREYEQIKSEFEKWDSVRGEWLSNSLLAIAKNNPIPNRIFPEDFTPYEMFSVIPSSNRENARKISDSRKNNPNTSQSNSAFWILLDEFLNRSSCRQTNGRTYGDPHFTSFDGNSFSLQSVGEFTLVKSQNGYVNVQARQTASGEDFSLNTAVAMNVGGDRLCFYANEKPDSDISTPIRLEGSPIRVTSSTYYLPHGGTIRSKGDEYIVTWPTGEKTVVQMRNNNRFSTMNISAFIFPCALGGYEGLLGNANGTPKDDLSIRGNNNSDLYASMSKYSTIFGDREITETANRQEKDYLDRLTRDFGNSFRITDMTSLFDYGPGQNTAYFSDFTFPRIHRTVGDLSQNQRTKAKKRCEEQGVTGEDLRGCIFDNAYLDIPPTPRPVVTDNTQGVVLPPVAKPRPTPVPVSSRPIVDSPNGNPTRPTISGKETAADKGVDQNSKPSSQTISTENTKPTSAGKVVEHKEVPVMNPEPVHSKPTIPVSIPIKVNPSIFKGETNSKPSKPSEPIKQNPVSKPAPVSPAPASKPAPVSTPVSKPTPTISTPKVGATILKKG